MTYLYESLSPERFQQFCQALLVSSFPNAQCLPVGQPDGGRDAFEWQAAGSGAKGRELYVFQVKFGRTALDREGSFVEDICKTERPKVDRLIRKGAKAYYLLTNIQGTAHPEVGTIDRMHAALSDCLGLPAYCWWRDDLDRRVDSNANIKWSYPEIIRGSDLLQALLYGALSEDGRRRNDAIRAYLAAQYDDDKEVKFKQVDLYNSLLDLFIDVPIRYRPSQDRPSNPRWEPTTRFVRADGADYYAEEQSRSAADFLLSSNALFDVSRIVLEGAPGQGKSTITQYICQVQRMRLLDYSDDLHLIPDGHRVGEVRLPFRVDLRDYASWLGGNDPFAADPKATRPADSNVSLESFLAYQVSHLSGGHTFSVSDLSAIAKTSYFLIVLDGFDEVANVQSREQVVREITRSVTRLETSGYALQVIVTSRPAAFANSPGFSEKNWYHFWLDALTISIVNEYAEKWMKARNLPYKDAADFRLVLSQKLDQPHMRDLARNPMQLAILLNLIQTRGLSLPDKRTALYDSYMELFFSREAEKSTIVREHRDLLLDLHRFLAWVIHTEAETSKGKGSITEERLKILLKSYLDEEGHPTELVDELFTGMVERVVALVSRIQGTFEFEVQPLREYFAARHLYDTAPYSPPGNEKKGTKPERFDALAVNFYWLNVTRFFCGCFSRGELSSLADGLEVLTTSSDVKDISYPKLLALMLLGDWVFAQQPLIVSKVVRVVIAQPGFRIILASMLRDRGGVSLALPERCGKAELVGAAKSAFLKSGYRDEELAVARVLREALSSGEIFKYWRELKPTGSISEEWINRGSMLGVYRLLSKDELVILYKEIGNALVPYLAHDDRFDVIESDNDIFTEAVRIVLGRGGHLFLSGIHRGEPAPFVSYLGTALDLATYASAVGSQAEYSFQHMWHRRSYSQPFAPAESIKGSIDGGMISRIERFLAVFKELSDQPASVWSTTLTPWSRLVDAGLREFGESPLFSEIAIIGAGIHSKSEVGRIGNNLYDATVPLCERTRYARLRSGAPKWWLDQLELADSKSKIDFALANLFVWGTTRTIALLLSKISELVVRWPRLSEQIFRVDKWSLCRG